MMWDERYSTKEYAYGKKPNAFLAERYSAIPKGKVLSLAEGEGRNAVFLAKQGYAVTAIDSSAVGLKKAEVLANESGVEIDLIQADLTEYSLGKNQWDGIVSIFCPLPSAIRKPLHQEVVAALKPGGVYLLEAYTPDQLKYDTGGGKSPDTMPTENSLRKELDGLSFIHILEVERKVLEGLYHTGLGAVVQVIAKKEM